MSDAKQGNGTQRTSIATVVGFDEGALRKDTGFPYTLSSVAAFISGVYIMHVDSVFLTATGGPERMRHQYYWLTRGMLLACLFWSMFLIAVYTRRASTGGMSGLRLLCHMCYVLFVAGLCSIASGLVLAGGPTAKQFIFSTAPITLLTGSFFYLAAEVYLRGRVAYERFEAELEEDVRQERKKMSGEIGECIEEIKKAREAGSYRGARQKEDELDAKRKAWNDRLRYNFLFDKLYNLRHPHQNGPPKC